VGEKIRKRKNTFTQNFLVHSVDIQQSMWKKKVLKAAADWPSILLDTLNSLP